MVEKESTKSKGGKREGAGRKPGIRNRLTQESIKAATETGITPLQFMLDIMRDAGNDLKTRFAAAAECAPYVHPKLAQMNHTGQIDIKHWSNEQLAAARDVLAAVTAAQSQGD